MEQLKSGKSYNMNEAQQIYDRNKLLNGQFPNGLSLVIPEGLTIDPSKKYEAIIREVGTVDSSLKESKSNESTESMY